VASSIDVDDLNKQEQYLKDLQKSTYDMHPDLKILHRRVGDTYSVTEPHIYQRYLC